MLDFMKLSQIAALYLGIIFSVLSIATTLLAVKYAKRLNSFAKALSLGLIVPFIACASWLYLILSFIDGLRKDEILTLVISLLLSVFIFGMVVIVSKALYSKHGASLEAYDKAIEEGKEKKAELETRISELENTEVENEQTDEVTVAPLLLEGTVESENDNVVIYDEENGDSYIDEQESIEETEETVEEVETVESEEAVEETTEAEETTIEEDVTEETETEEDVTESVDTEDMEENQEETTEEVEEPIEIEETEEESDDSDEEFEKFLEELRKKVDSANDEDDDK